MTSHLQPFASARHCRCSWPAKQPVLIRIYLAKQPVYFSQSKRLPLALLLVCNPPSLQAMNVSTAPGPTVRYTLLNLPHYLSAFLGEIATPFTSLRGMGAE